MQLHTINKISEHITAIKSDVMAMIAERKEANAMEDSAGKAETYCRVVKPRMDGIRYHIDKLEILVEDSMWPLPKYREMLFVK